MVALFVRLTTIVRFSKIKSVTQKKEDIMAIINVRHIDDISCVVFNCGRLKHSGVGDSVPQAIRGLAKAIVNDYIEQFINETNYQPDTKQRCESMGKFIDNARKHDYCLSYFLSREDECQCIAINPLTTCGISDLVDVCRQGWAITKVLMDRNHEETITNVHFEYNLESSEVVFEAFDSGGLSRVATTGVYNNELIDELTESIRSYIMTHRV